LLSIKLKSLAGVSLTESVLSIKLLMVLQHLLKPILNGFKQKDITSWKKDMAELTGIRFAGMK